MPRHSTPSLGLKPPNAPKQIVMMHQVVAGDGRAPRADHLGVGFFVLGDRDAVFGKMVGWEGGREGG